MERRAAQDAEASSRSADETLITPSKILVYPEYVIAVYHGDSADVRYGSLEDLYADHLIANTEEA